MPQANYEYVVLIALLLLRLLLLLLCYHTTNTTAGAPAGTAAAAAAIEIHQNSVLPFLFFCVLEVFSPLFFFVFSRCFRRHRC